MGVGKRLSNMVSIEIRPPFENEAEAINALIKRVFMECVAPDYSVEGIQFFLGFCSTEVVLKKISETGQIIVAVERNEVLGVIQVRDTNHISRYFVDVNYQRKGIGRQLFNYLLEGIKKNYPDVDEITVNSSPFARKAYEGLGFRATDNEQVGNGMKYIPMVYKINN